ncbi:MAG TPA: FMN-binding protein [Candidatus Izemoplasmatales bacterium]|nr:FMN-binding protein [Candidatus Izemoplasmatales bacterium]
MKEFLNKKGLIILFSAVLLIIFVFGGMYSRYMTNQIDVHEQERYEEELIRNEERFKASLINMVEDGASLTSFESNGSDKMYAKPRSDDDYQPTLIESYKIYDNTNDEIAIVYVLESIGNAEGVRIAYAISLERDRLIDVQVVSHNETVTEENEYYNRLDDQFFGQFENKDMDVIDYSIDAVADATLSSLAFETGMHYARELYANDTDFEIVTLVLAIDSLAYNSNLQTVNDYPFQANITFDQDDKTAVVALDSDFNYLSTISGQTPSQTVIDAIPVYVSEQISMDTSVNLDNYDSSARTLTITVRGFAGLIAVDLLINDSLDGIESVSLKSSNESYPSPNPPKVENDFINEYNTNGDVLDTVGGATVTSNAMAKVIQWIQTYETLLNGGN